MTITLRWIGNGRPVGGGETVTRQDDGAAFVVDNWSEGTCKVYAHRAGRAFRGSDEFNPSALGLYIGHERGRPVSEIQWGTPAPGTQHVPTTEHERELICRALLLLQQSPEAGPVAARELAALRDKFGG